MKIGEVYVWETGKVEGRSARRKYQVFICGDEEDHTFLFISSADWFKDYKILQANYGFLSYDSFIGCNAIISYTAEELRQANPQLVGQLSIEDMKGLRDALIAAETMERRHLNRVCAALAAIL
jgi:hypothetical protein